MKKVLVLIVLLFISLSLYAQKPLIKIYDIDGNETKYNIEDINQIDFVKSNMLYKMVVYKHDTTNTFLIANIKSLTFIKLDSIKINFRYYPLKIAIAQIDSIVFISVNCSEVTTGTQTWTCKNLDVDHYRNGDSIPEVRDSKVWGKLKTGAWCYYDNDPALGAIYGKLYNWYAVNDPRGLAPAGWHIPNIEEWIDPSFYLGGFDSAQAKMSFTGTIDEGDGLWVNYNHETNETGFSALPGGFRYSFGGFNDIGYNAFWWSSSDSDSTVGFGYSILSSEQTVDTSSFNKGCGFSIRCVKDSGFGPPVIDSITPNLVTNLDTISIKGSNFRASQGSSYITLNTYLPEKIDYISWSDTVIKLKIHLGPKKWFLTVNVIGKKSNAVDFTTFNSINYGSVTDIDGKVYKTVKIGNQWWMAENLDVSHYRNGDQIPEVKDSVEWSKLTTGAWCYYNNDPALGAIYGKLYNWYAVSDPRGLAPEGWHVSSLGEWNELGGFLKSSPGEKLKSTGTIENGDGLWLEPNEGATNETGFSGLPSGFRDYKSEFMCYEYCTYFWTSTLRSTSLAGYTCLANFLNGYIDGVKEFAYGCSIRCVKD